MTITVDRVDPSDEISQPPENLVVLDVLADVTDGDSWTLGAFGERTLRGSRFVYGYPPEDPNTPGPRAPLLVNPGTANRFVSSVSKPRPRDANMRFRNGGASTEGDCGPAPSPYAYATHFAVAWVSNPPETSGSPTLDGAILRTGRHCRVWRKPGGGAPAW